MKKVKVQLRYNFKNKIPIYIFAFPFNPSRKTDLHIIYVDLKF